MFFNAPSVSFIVGLSTPSSPPIDNVSYALYSQPAHGFFSLFTTPVVAIAVNESLRAADMARKCTRTAEHAGGRVFFILSV